MVNVKVLEEIKRRLETEIEVAKEILAQGKLIDWREYGYTVGGIKGMRDAVAIIDEVVSKMSEG